MAKKTEKVFVSVIMPAYNEERHIEACFNKVAEVLKDYGKPFEVILEEDGSTDRTPEIIDSIAGKYSCVKALHFVRKVGKGFGIRKCFEVAQGEYIVLIDSDMEYPPEKMPELLEKINGHDIVVGSRSIWRNKKNGNIKAVRAYLSLAYGILVKRLFGISVRDYQSGFKAFRREVINTIKPLTSNGFEIDSEILIKASRKGFKIECIPITYTYKGNSKVNICYDSIRMFFSLLRWGLNNVAESSPKEKTILGPFRRFPHLFSSVRLKGAFQRLIESQRDYEGP